MLDLLLVWAQELLPDWENLGAISEDNNASHKR